MRTSGSTAQAGTIRAETLDSYLLVPYSWLRRCSMLPRVVLPFFPRTLTTVHGVDRVLGRYGLLIALILLPGVASAQSIFGYWGAFDFATYNAKQQFVANRFTCLAPGCTQLPPLGGGTGQVNSSDWGVGQAIVINNLANGEVVSWTVTPPGGSSISFFSLTWNGALGCFVDSDGYDWCVGGDYIIFIVVAIINSCEQTFSTQETGPWSISSYDGDRLLYTTPFVITRNPSSPLTVISPTDNQLFQLLQGSYNATGTVNFSAATNTGQPIGWTVYLHYQSSSNYPNPATDPAPLTFQGNTYSYSGYQSIGGQVQVWAQTTAADGSLLQDCLLCYVEGPETGPGGGSGGQTGGSGIPDPTITARLDQLYPASSSYKKYLNDNTATLNLMTGVAGAESSYHQFLTPAEGNSDLFSLYANFAIPAKWPNENPATSTVPRGKFIGLMQVPTTDPDAWDWTVNTQDGVNVFSGGSGDKVQTSVTYEGYIISGNRSLGLPAHINGNGSYLRSLHGGERENNALVLYGGYLYSCKNKQPCIVNSLYYIPQCPSPGVQVTNKQGNLVCQGGTWQWVVNNANQSAGIGYVTAVRGGRK